MVNILPEIDSSCYIAISVKLKKGPGTSFQSQALSQKYIRNFVCYKKH